MNLTERQQKFLVQIVEANDLTGGIEFIFVESKPRSGLAYTRAIRYWAEGDVTDLTRLRAEGLVDFRPVAQHQYAGKPTQLGINAVRQGRTIQPDGQVGALKQPPEQRPEAEQADSAGKEETIVQRSARRCAIVDPLMKLRGFASDDEWAMKAGDNMDRNTPRDYRNGKTKRLRRSTRQLLASALGVDVSKLPD